jgi:hypothetical protein
MARWAAFGTSDSHPDRRRFLDPDDGPVAVMCPDCLDHDKWDYEERCEYCQAERTADEVQPQPRNQQ